MTAIGGQVYVVDDDRDLADSIARMLSRRGFTAVSFSDPRAFLHEMRSEEPACLVSDVMMGDLDGFELARQVRDRLPFAAIIFMTSWPRTRDAVAAIRDLGGLDYLEKPLDQNMLVDAVARGVSWSRERHEAGVRLATLSPRERQIFALLVKGRTNKTIAAELTLSIKTVEDHRAAIMRKTGLVTLAQLIDLAS